MKKIIFAITLFLSLTTFAQKDSFVGFYKGELSAPKYGYPFGADNTVYAEVFRDSNGYRLKLLPYIFANAEVMGQADNLSASGDVITVSNVGSGEKFSNFKGVISPDKIDLQVQYLGKPAKIELKRVNVEVPSMNKQAPKNAIVLFDGKDLSAFKTRFRGKEVPMSWIIKDGSMTVDLKKKESKYADIATKRVFDGPVFLHLEFMTPCNYSKPRVERSNSGVFFFNTYEIQILDSFGSEGYWDETGSVYRQIPPQANASLEPGVWQTMDIEFYPAVYEGKKLVREPMFSVWHNGVKVQSQSPAKFPTRLHPKQGAQFDISKHTLKGDVSIQGHGAEILFRNIWIIEKK